MESVLKHHYLLDKQIIHLYAITEFLIPTHTLNKPLDAQ
jgi:hypothetical protein